ncbi:GGDEF domain-containing protein [Aquamicrobium sp. LC103]|uniref:GGDEF domain-containing protein n=1 Tax=Aquamicrobium sp. LC103 TaxID=1120658 RepID=UPI00063EBC6C|nr:GGDEF domain-containing protein [Aquamicrobium sp. LC103]TKT75006.1 GGDEF domain-containing protein [Aquamicrobium sp. LC103]
MQRIILNSTVAALGSAAASLLIVAVMVPALGGSVDGNAILMSILCPLVIAWPASAYTFWQKERLAMALAELKATHLRLEDAHSALAEAHARLAEKARRDEMTGLLNRETFFAALEKSRRRTDAGTLLIVDADNFKAINDNFGHLKGDEALRLISAAIRGAVREGDLLGRIGGEEFAVFLAGVEGEEAAQAAERLRQAVERLRFFPDDDAVLPLTVSIGGTPHRPRQGLSDLMRAADGRLYEAKRLGRNRVVLDGSVSAAA